MENVVVELRRGRRRKHYLNYEIREKDLFHKREKRKPKKFKITSKTSLLICLDKMSKTYEVLFLSRMVK